MEIFQESWKSSHWTRQAETNYSTPWARPAQRRCQHDPCFNTIAVTILVSTAAIAPSPGTISSKFRMLNLPQLIFQLNFCIIIQQLHLPAWIQGQNLLRIGILCHSPMPGWRSLPQLERLRWSSVSAFPFWAKSFWKIKKIIKNTYS